MDTSNSSPNQAASGDWRAQLEADSLEKIVNKILDTLKKHLPYSGDEGLRELRKISVKYEEKNYTAATSQALNFNRYWDISRRTQALCMKGAVQARR